MRMRSWQVRSPMDGFVRRLAKKSVVSLSLGLPFTMSGKPFVVLPTVRCGVTEARAAYGTGGFAIELELPGAHVEDGIPDTAGRGRDTSRTQ